MNYQARLRKGWPRLIFLSLFYAFYVYGTMNLYSRSANICSWYREFMFTAREHKLLYNKETFL